MPPALIPSLAQPPIKGQVYPTRYADAVRSGFLTCNVILLKYFNFVWMNFHFTLLFEHRANIKCETHLTINGGGNE